MHPAWEYRLWTDVANRALVAEHYPWLLETYDAFPENIMRADTARILYMHRFGGAHTHCPIACTARKLAAEISRQSCANANSRA